MQKTIPRRELLAAAAGAAALSACNVEKPVTPARVSVVRAPAYDQSVYDTVRRLLDEHQVNVRGLHVVLKPNLVEFEGERNINTTPIWVHAALEASGAGGAASVRIAEGPGHRNASS